MVANKCAECCQRSGIMLYNRIEMVLVIGASQCCYHCVIINNPKKSNHGTGNGGLFLYV